jgi:hypothetical protein
MLDSPEGVCPGQARFEYPATSVLFSSIPYRDTTPIRLSGARLAGADLRGANLRGVDLRGALLGPGTSPSAFVRGFISSIPSFQDVLQRAANFHGATANKDTKWPSGFDWKAAGVALEDETAAAQGKSSVASPELPTDE